MKKTKRLLAIVLAAVVTLTGMSMNVFAAGGVSLTGNYYDVGANGKVTGTGTANPNVKIEDVESDAYINMSKTAKPTSNENEFEITLNVETMEKLDGNQTTEPASVVLAFNVDTSMDQTVDGLVPSDPRWKVEDTCWAALKKAAEEFIDNFLADSGSSNEISIVIYGGNEYNTSGIKATERTVWKLICDWTNDSDIAKASFDYDVVGEDTIFFANLTDVSSLRYAVFNDMYNKYGQSCNMQAGFKGVINQLGSYDSNNDPYVIFLSTGDADDCDEVHLNGYRNEATSVDAAITEAGNLKTIFSESILYTVGFGAVAKNSLVLTTSPPIDEYYPAADADKLKIAYETILSKVYTASEAWTVTDPLPDYVTLKHNSISDKDNAKYDAASRTITWDLVNSTPTKKTEGNKTIYTYALAYTVTVDATGMNEGEIYPLNKQTTLSHTFTTPDTGMFGAEETANFLVPTVTMGQPVQTQAYTVIYDANGGKGSHTDAELTAGSNYAVKQVAVTKITRDGYSFKGWNTKADGSGKLYAPGDTITITENMKLYAQWEQTGSGLSTPKTGDTSNMVLWIVLLLVALSGAVIMLVVNKRKQHKS